MENTPEQPGEDISRFREQNAAQGSEYYQRGGSAQTSWHYGTPEKLQALSQGYFNLNWVFVLNVVLSFSLNIVTGLLSDQVNDSTGTKLVLIWGGLLAVLFGVVAIATYPQNKKIGYGLGWQPFGPIIASLLMGLNSALCCGILGYIVMQQLASTEIKKYGVKSRAFGLRKRDIQAKLAEMNVVPSS